MGVSLRDFMHNTNPYLDSLVYNAEMERDIDEANSADEWLGQEAQNEMKNYPCDNPDPYCPFDAVGGMDCRNFCGLGVDDDEEGKE